jgi:D-glycero-D-manno-heptose 1,7-bisphosphate phosphatase
MGLERYVPPGMQRRRFVLLDRDGTVMVEKHYLADPEGAELIPGAAAALRRLAQRGLGLAVVTNQSGVGRGYFDLARLAEIHRRLENLLEREGVRLDGIFFCPHHPDAGCACRKPRTGLVTRAAQLLDFDPSRAFVVGDLPSDVALARAVSATSVLVRTGHGARTVAGGEAAPDHVVDDLPAAAALIERLLAAEG